MTDFLTYALVLLFNLGLTISLTFGGMLLVRPVTNRLLRPRQRALLWYFGWYFMRARITFICSSVFYRNIVYRKLWGI